MQLPGRFLIILLSLLLQHCTSRQMQSHCNALTTCSDCISSPLFPCVWCRSKAYVDMFFPPCDARDILLHRGCPQDDVFTADEGLSFVNGSGSVSPSKVFASMRPTARQSFEIRVNPPVNFPVDVYMLFDNTQSMDPYIDIAKLMAVRLLEFVQSVSSSSRVGFGTFVDKETLPFHFNQDNKSDYIGPSHAFRNIHSLAPTIGFSLKNFTLGTNDDAPEGILEAIIQAVTCTEEIGWRGLFEAYRLIVVMTDAEYHYALDGRIAGIITPNDIKCKVENGVYVNNGAQDYPTIYRLLSLLVTENIFPIMITDGDLAELYKELFRNIGIENSITVLSTNLELILNTTQNIYGRASTSAIPFVVQEADIINYSLEIVDCGGGKYDNASNSCFEIPTKSKATYRLEVWLDSEASCNHGHNYEHNLDLHFLAFGSVEVTILPICKCNCSDVTDSNSSACGPNGKLNCGVCECNEGFSGPACNCTDLTQSCIAPGADVVCSNRGKCNCGVCSCYGSSLGSFCECEAASCPFYNGEACGGPSRGACGCDGRCDCTDNYEDGINGKCSCLKPGTAESIEQCTDPNSPSNELCNGHGGCVCGRCECDDGEVLENPSYEGKYCEICNVCDDSCDLLRPCLSCRFSTGDLSCCSEIPGDSIRIVNANLSSYSDLIRNPNYRMCTIIDQGGCIWDYAILANLTGSEQEIEILTRTRACNTPTWWPWVVGAFLIVAVTGIIVVIIIRVIVKLIENKEFDKFWQEKKNTIRFTDSPLYNPPFTEIENPGYGKIVSQD